MKKNYILLASFLMMIFHGNAQNSMFAKQIIIANGGSYSNPDDFVDVAVYNLETENYQVFDVIKTQSVQDVIISGNFAFVAAQDSLVKYNIDTYERVAAIELNALKKLAIYEDKLIVTRQYPETEDFIYILNQDDLSEINKLSTSGETSGIVISGDTAYVAVPGSWGTTQGKLAIIDLNTETITKEINFGSIAKGLKDVMINNSVIYTVNSHFSDYTNNVYSISKYNTLTGDTATNVFSGDYYGFYGSSILAGGKILFPLSMDIAAYSIADETVSTFTAMNPSAMVFNSIENQVIITESNYADWGKLHTYSLDGNIIGSELAIGIAPEGIAIDYRSDEGIQKQNIEKSLAIGAYPNPCSDNIFVRNMHNVDIQSIVIGDLSGRVVKQINEFSDLINVSGLSKGVYSVQIFTKRGVYTEKLIKN